MLQLDTNSTVKAADLLIQLVDSFIAFAPSDKPRDVEFTTHVVIDISSKLIRCLSETSSQLIGHTTKLDNIINTILRVRILLIILIRNLINRFSHTKFSFRSIAEARFTL